MGVGQMIAQMLVGLPATAAVPVTSPVTAMPDDGQETSAFAGLLQVMSANDIANPAVGTIPAKAVPAGNSDAMEAEPAPAQADTTPDSMAMLLVMAHVGNDVTSSSPAVRDPSLEQPEKTGQQTDDSPQNVVWSLAGIQALPAQQINGGMPESAVTHADATTRPARIADAGEACAVHAVVKPETTDTSRMNASTTQFPDVAGILYDSYNLPIPATQQNAVASTSTQQGISPVQELLPPATQPVADVTTTRDGAMREAMITSKNAVSVPTQPEKMVTAEPVIISEGAVSKEPETVTTRTLTHSVLDTYFQTKAAPSGNSTANSTSLGQVSADVTSNQSKPAMPVSSVQPVLDIRLQTSAVPSGSSTANSTPSGQVVADVASNQPKPSMPVSPVQPVLDIRLQTSAVPSGNSAANSAPSEHVVADVASNQPKPSMPVSVVQPAFDTRLQPAAVPSGNSTANSAPSGQAVEDVASNQPKPSMPVNVVQPVSDTQLRTTATLSDGGVANAIPEANVANPLPIGDAVAHDTHVLLASRIPVDGKGSSSQTAQEAQALKPDAPVTVESGESRASENVAVVAVKKAMTASSGESFSQDRDSASDQKTGTQDHMASLHQVKFESAPLVANTSGAPAGEPVRTNVMEHVVNQVREHLAGRDIKSGSEQVVIRLSPESLGELKLNLRMENQCLKVSIVAENNQVRDSLIKHSDTLKETLARQNITMESFDVSTESNDNGTSLHGQSRSGWQEQARQQQNTAWNAAGGYRANNTPDMTQRPLYQASAEYSMVDVHF